jgi:perosamine synthetase
LNSVAGLKLPVSKTDCADNIYWVYGIVLDKDIKADNKDIQKMLAEEGIGTRTFFWCMHEQPVYQKIGLFKNEKYPNAEYLARKGFYIPSGLALTREQMDEVIDKVIGVIDKVS